MNTSPPQRLKISILNVKIQLGEGEKSIDDRGAEIEYGQGRAGLSGEEGEQTIPILPGTATPLPVLGARLDRIYEQDVFLWPSWGEGRKGNLGCG